VILTLEINTVQYFLYDSRQIDKNVIKLFHSEKECDAELRQKTY